MVATLVESTAVKSTIDGGVSSVMRALVDQCFFGEHDVSRAGWMVEFTDGSATTLFMRIGIIVSDEAAIHHMFNCKGSSGLKCCCLCSNVYNKNETRGIIERDPTAVHHTCTDWSKVQLTTPDLLNAIFTTLASATGSAADIAEMETSLGWMYHPKALLATERLRSLVSPLSSCTWDWMHVFYVSGIFNTCSFLVIKLIIDSHVKRDDIHCFVASFTCPSKVKPADVLTAKRWKSSTEAGHLRASASECLSLMPILAQYCQHLLDMRHGSGDLRLQLRCFLMLCRVLALISRGPRLGINPDELRTAINNFIRNFVYLNTNEKLTPKWHFMQHLPDQIHGGWLQNCFVHERKHKQIKRFQNDHRNVNAKYAQYILRSVTHHFIGQLLEQPADEFDDSLRLINARSPTVDEAAKIRELIDDVDTDGLTVAISMRAAETVSKKDLILVSEGDSHFLGELAIIAKSNDGIFFCIIKKWDCVSNETRSWTISAYDADVDPTSAFKVILASKIVCALTWDSAKTALKPLHCMQYSHM